MEFQKVSNKAKNHQFLEVDEDLRRIGEREASKGFCPFGLNCYRKNPIHLLQYRHHSNSGALNKNQSNDRNCVKRGKITDYFNQKPLNVKELSIESEKCGKDINQKEDNSKDNPINDSMINNNLNTSVSREPSPKRKRLSHFKSEIEVKTANNDMNAKKSNDIWITSDFDDIKSNDNIIELKSKRINNYSKRNFSPKISKPKTIDKKGIKDKALDLNKIDDKTKSQINLNIKESDVSKTLISPLMKPKLTPNELNEIIKEIFLFEMPKDFFILWQFCKTIKREKPEDALIETLGLRLVGPYDILTGRVKNSLIKDKEQILCHWRYFYDLPEFQTVIASNKSGYHLGYFRDTPEEDNPVVVSNNCDKSCFVEGMADNICAAIYCEIRKLKPKESSNLDLKQLETKFKEFCVKNKIDLNANSKLKSRKSKINAKTFNGFGFVVPYDKKTEVGYRPLPETDSNLKKILNSIIKVDSEVRNECKPLIELQEIIQLVSYANDECDFGMGLELGIDLFCFGDPFFHKSSLHLLSMAYDLLNRQPFSRIIKAHLQNRRKGFKLESI